MKTQLEFELTAFPAYPGEEEQINPGRFGKRLAEFIAEALPAYGFKATNIGNEDWGWMVEVENEAFPMWIGCGNIDDSTNEFQCFIEPSKPVIKRWFKKTETTQVVENLAQALEALLTKNGKISKFRWVE